MLYFLLIIVFYYVVGNDIDGDVYVFRFGQSGLGVEVFDVQIYESSVRSGYYAVHEKFKGGGISTWCVYQAPVN